MSGRLGWMPTDPALGLPWLIRLRWLTLGAQALSVATAAWTAARPVDLELPALLLAAVALSNLALVILQRRPRDLSLLVGPFLIVDTLLLTALLSATGGPMNPFTTLYLVHITLAAVLLGTRWVWLVFATALGGYGLLFVLAPSAPLHSHGMSAHLRGMWIAFGVAAALIAAFLSSLTRRLAERERQLMREREYAARSRRVAALTSLAAGAAHELGTPIGTIALAAGELERELSSIGLPEEALADVRLIRAEVRRCRQVLDGLSTAAGEAPGERLTSLSSEALVEGALRRLGSGADRVTITGVTDPTLTMPRGALALALSNLLRNALDAGPSAVELEISVEGEEVVFEVRDAGAGMDEQTRRRATEPFFSTKPEGAGMGMGLFLVDALAEQLGGELELRSRPGEGTTARLRMPRNVQLRRISP